MDPNLRALSRTDIVALVDPQLRPALDDDLVLLLDAGPLEIESLRALDAARIVLPEVTPAPELIDLARPDGTVLALRVHRPRGTEPRPVVLWIHGGGMILGEAVRDDELCRRYVESLDAVVVAVDYRLAPEHPYPAALDDCTLALDAITSGAIDGADPARIAVAGASAGGGLALGLALRERDRGRSAIRHVQAIYPMIDDRRDTDSSVTLADAPVWNERLAALAWESYLAGAPADAYAAPARADDLRGLPSIDLDTAEYDMFRDEDIALASRLFAAGVPCELHVEPRTVHGFDGIAPGADVSVRSWTRRAAALGRALASPETEATPVRD